MAESDNPELGIDVFTRRRIRCTNCQIFHLGLVVVDVNYTNISQKKDLVNGGLGTPIHVIVSHCYLGYNIIF